MSDMNRGNTKSNPILNLTHYAEEQAMRITKITADIRDLANDLLGGSNEVDGGKHMNQPKPSVNGIISALESSFGQISTELIVLEAQLSRLNHLRMK